MGNAGYGFEKIFGQRHACPTATSAPNRAAHKEGKMLVFFFRGRNTSGIIADAQRAGVMPEDAAIRVIAAAGDSLREQDDMTPAQAYAQISEEAGHWVSSWRASGNWRQVPEKVKVTVVMNGGGTTPVMEFIAGLARLVTYAAGPGSMYATDLSSESSFYTSSDTDILTPVLDVTLVDVQWDGVRKTPFPAAS